MDVNRVQLLLNLDSGSASEPPVDSELFLRSFLSFSVWARVLAARSVLRWAAEPQSSIGSQLAAGSAFYQLMGLFFEDAVTTLAGWTCWAEDRSLLLADVVARVNIRRGERAPSSIAEFKAKIAKAVRQSRPAALDPGALLGLLASQSELEILDILGIRAATMLRHTEEGAAKGIVDMLSQASTRHLIPINNKLKHGPQVVLMAVPEAAAKRCLISTAGIPGARIRLLFEGARTQERSSDAADARVAPFLLHELHFLQKMLFEVLLPVSSVLFQLGSALYEDVFNRPLPLALDPAVLEMFREVSAAKAGGTVYAVSN